MATVTCLDGSALELHPVAVLARDHVAFEVTLHLLRDGVPFGAVGERCGWLLTSAATRLRAAGTGDGASPTTAVEAGVRAVLGCDQLLDLLEVLLAQVTAAGRVGGASPRG